MCGCFFFIKCFVALLKKYLTLLKKILIVSATEMEIRPLLAFLKGAAQVKGHPLFSQNGYEIDVVITGVGIANTSLHLGKALNEKNYHLALNVGIAGSFDRRILRGEVVEVISEQYGDLGVEEADGTFTDVFEIGLIKENEKPFKNGQLLNHKPLKYKNIKQVKGLTVQTVHGTAESIEAVWKKYKPDVETMEGAAFFQACLMFNAKNTMSFAQIRAISNYVEPRNRANWKMPEAIGNLNKTLIDLFEKRIL
jgi:futalosine hydrolase